MMIKRYNVSHSALTGRCLMILFKINENVVRFFYKSNFLKWKRNIVYTSIHICTQSITVCTSMVYNFLYFLFRYKWSNLVWCLKTNVSKRLVKKPFIPYDIHIYGKSIHIYQVFMMTFSDVAAFSSKWKYNQVFILVMLLISELNIWILTCNMEFFQNEIPQN